MDVKSRSLFDRLSFSLAAVPGSIIDRTSRTNWLTEGPTWLAPIRMTIDFGARDPG